MDSCEGPRKRRRHVLLAISGKRCAGKDFVTHVIREALEKAAPGASALRLAFADQCKREFAAREGLDAERLFNDREYKEMHRPKMTEFYHRTVESDPAHFIVGVMEEVSRFFETVGHNAAVCIITDLRRLDEAKVIGEASVGASRTILIRVMASDDARHERGWTPDPIKDSDPTECELDGFAFDLYLCNNAPLSDKGAKVLKQVNSVIIPLILNAEAAAQSAEHAGYV